MLPIIYFLKYLVRSGIRTHAYSCRDLNAYLFLHIEWILRTSTMLPTPKYLVRSGIRTHAYSCRMP